MSSNWKNIQKILKGERSGAATTNGNYFMIGKGESGMMNIDKDSLNNTFHDLGIEVYDHVTGEI